MKQLLSALSIIYLLIGITPAVSAQIKRPGFVLGGNVNYAMPQGTFDDTHRFGVGGELYGGVGLGKTFIIGTVGANYFHPEPNNPEGRVTYVPMKVGVRQYLFGRRFFVNGDVGIGSVKSKNMAEADTRFVRGFGAGIRLLGLEAQLYHDGWKRAEKSGFDNSLLFKVGWSFGL